MRRVRGETRDERHPATRVQCVVREYALHTRPAEGGDGWDRRCGVLVSRRGDFYLSLDAYYMWSPQRRMYLPRRTGQASYTTLFVVIAVGLGLVANTAGAEQSVQTWAGGRDTAWSSERGRL